MEGGGGGEVVEGRREGELRRGEKTRGKRGEEVLAKEGKGRKGEIRR